MRRPLREATPDVEREFQGLDMDSSIRMREERENNNNLTRMMNDENEQGLMAFSRRAA